MTGDRKPEAEDEVRERVEKKPVSFADYEGAWREGKGMSTEEVIAYVRWLRGHEDDAAGDEQRAW